MMDLFFLPWWVSGALALFVYVFIAHIIPNIAFENIYFESVRQTLTSHFFFLVGCLLVFILLILACASFLNSTRKKRLPERQNSLQDIRDLEWREFEELVAEIFRREGYTVTENIGTGADGGIDIRLRMNGKTYLVQCKNWKTQKVGVSIVREMYGILTAERANEVFIVCSGRFTPAATEFAKNKPIKLLGEKFLAQILMLARDKRAIPEISIERTTEQKPLSASSQCPKCGSALIVRKAKKGKNAGREFIGCAGFPKCRYIRGYSDSG